MKLLEDPFLSRDDAALADRLDERVDQLAGLRYQNFAAGANLKMSARLEALDAWRRQGEQPMGLTAALACAAAFGLKADPLFATLFDGRDRLEVPERPSLGVGLDGGARASILVLPEATGLGAGALGARIDAAIGAGRPGSDLRLDFSTEVRVPRWRRYRRWARMVAQEVRERFDYLAPPLQNRRFAHHARESGHFQVHNIGALGVEEFKGFLRRPAVAALWVLRAERRVAPDGSGGFVSQLRLPLVLVYAQELIPLDRACAFLRLLVGAIEDPAGALGDRP